MKKNSKPLFCFHVSFSTAPGPGNPYFYHKASWNNNSSKDACGVSSQLLVHVLCDFELKHKKMFKEQFAFHFQNCSVQTKTMAHYKSCVAKALEPPSCCTVVELKKNRVPYTKEGWLHVTISKTSFVSRFLFSVLF